MALEQVFFDPRALKRFRAGPLASKLDGFCEWLSKHGFARCTIQTVMDEYINWLKDYYSLAPGTLMH